MKNLSNKISTMSDSVTIGTLFIINSNKDSDSYISESVSCGICTKIQLFKYIQSPTYWITWYFKEGIQPWRSPYSESQLSKLLIDNKCTMII